MKDSARNLLGDVLVAPQALWQTLMLSTCTEYKTHLFTEVVIDRILDHLLAYLCCLYVANPLNNWFNNSSRLILSHLSFHRPHRSFLQSIYPELKTISFADVLRLPGADLSHLEPVLFASNLMSPNKKMLQFKKQQHLLGVPCYS